MLEVLDLHTHYGRAQILYGVSFAIGRGEVVALMGRNGAGKSTTLKSIIGLVRPSAGRITFAGQEITGRAPHVIARQGLGYVPEDRRIFPELSVAENLEVGRQPPRPGTPIWTQERLLELFPALGTMLDRQGARMSGGEQQMLCIARTLAGNPKAILLDEPSEGLAPVVVAEVARAILELKHAGVAVLLAEQNRRFIERVADRGYTLEKGRITTA